MTPHDIFPFIHFNFFIWDMGVIIFYDPPNIRIYFFSRMYLYFTRILPNPCWLLILGKEFSNLAHLNNFVQQLSFEDLFSGPKIFNWIFNLSSLILEKCGFWSKDDKLCPFVYTAWILLGSIIKTDNFVFLPHIFVFISKHQTNFWTHNLRCFKKIFF